MEYFRRFCYTYDSNLYTHTYSYTHTHIFDGNFNGYLGQLSDRCFRCGI